MPANHLIIGSPAKAIRELSEQELAWKQQGTREYQVLVSAASSLCTVSSRCVRLSLNGNG